MINGIAIGLSALAGVWLGWIALPSCLLVVVIIKLLERDRRIGVLLTCLIFASIGAVRSEEPPTVSTTPQLKLSTGAIGTVASFPIPSADGHRAILSLSELCIADQCIPTDTRVLVYFREQNPPLSLGQVVQVDWRMQSLQDLATGYRGFVSSQGAEGSAHATTVHLIGEGRLFFQWMANANQRVVGNMETLLPGDTGALGTGIVTGDDSGLSVETEDNFRTTGTSHLTAVSGQNVSLIIGFMSFWYTPKTIRKRVVFHLILIATVWNFTIFVGMEPPALRAAIVATLTVCGNHVGRRPDPVTLLALTLGIIALINPLVVYAVGFWLSATASMALCLALPRTLKGSPRQIFNELARAPGIASIATMPVTLMSFGVWSPIGILANMLIAPVMIVAFPLTYLFAVVASIAPALAEHFAWAPAIPLDIALVIVNRLAPVAMQWRIDTFSPVLGLLLWTPILIGIWLVSNESHRWIRRILTSYRATTS